MLSWGICARRRWHSISYAGPGSSSTRRRVTGGVSGIGAPFGERLGNGKGERRAHTRGGLAGNVAPVAPYQCAHICQAHAFARDVLPADAAEGLKDMGNIGLGDAPAVVLYREHGYAR